MESAVTVVSVGFPYNEMNNSSVSRVSLMK